MSAQMETLSTICLFITPEDDVIYSNTEDMRRIYNEAYILSVLPETQNIASLTKLQLNIIISRLRILRFNSNMDTTGLSQVGPSCS